MTMSSSCPLCRVSGLSMRDEILAELVVEVFDAGAYFVCVLEWVAFGVGDTDCQGVRPSIAGIEGGVNVGAGNRASA